MYKLVLYTLIALCIVSVFLSSFGIISFSPIALIFSILLITTICLAVNMLFAKVFSAPANVESVYITALILALIISPASSPQDFVFISFAFWASVLAIGSKYILALFRKHIFNPAAISVAITAFFIGQYATWWVATLWMAPFVLIGGLLITRKIRRFDLVLSFFATAIITSFIIHIADYAHYTTYFWRMISISPLFFFGFIMLTEPLTTPPSRGLRILYGIFTGIIFVPSVHFASLYSTPELALVAGNVFSFLVSPKKKLLLKLDERETIAKDTYDFRFISDKNINFTPGQYIEWTIKEGKKVDSRGNRRYFTISSSPTEDHFSMGVKYYPEPSTFKKDLYNMKKGDIMVASQLAGDFVLPKDKSKKLVFIAGGIGITPFRSMIKYLIDTNEKRDIVLLYSNRTREDIAYKDIFDEANRKLGIKTVYAITDNGAPGFTGFVDAKMIIAQVPDFKDRYFYISGPHSMVTIFESTLSKIGVRKSHIKTDYFPGFA